MEEHTVVKKRSVAELAGKFSCPIPHTTDGEVNKPVRRRPPRSLPLPAGNDAGQGQDEKAAETVSTRKNRNSALIEKLQANLTLSPTGPPIFPKSPGVVKFPVPCFPPGSPSSPSSPPAITTPKEEENPASFESPVDGSVLKSINKGRARHSIKRRPPSRRHRKSSTEDGGEEVDKSPSESTTPNGLEGDVFKEKTESPSSKEQTERETKPTDLEEKTEENLEISGNTEGEEKTEPEEKEETDIAKKTEEQEKTEAEVKEEKNEDEPQSEKSPEETREEAVTQPQTEADTTHEEQKEDQVNC